MDDATISFLVLGALVALFLSNRFPVEAVALAGALALYVTGVLDLDQTLAGFGDPTVAFIAALWSMPSATPDRTRCCSRCSWSRRSWAS